MNSDRIREIYEDFTYARLDRLAEVLDDKIDFLSHAPPEVFPFLGRRRGREEVLQAVSEAHKKLEVLTFWPITTVLDGDQAALTVLIKVKDRATSKTASFLAAHFMRFRDDRIVGYCAIIDSLDAVRQMAGETQPIQTETLPNSGGPPLKNHIGRPSHRRRGPCMLAENRNQEWLLRCWNPKLLPSFSR